MIPTLPYIQQKFSDFNDLIFEGKLPPLPISIGHAQRALGGVRYMKRRNFWGREVYSDFRMVISARFDLPESEVEDTLIHEMIHYYILYHQIHDSSAHGKVFRRLMSEINLIYGRHVSVSHKMTADSPSSEIKVRAHYFCICRMEDGRLGIMVAAKSRIFMLWDAVPRAFRLREYRWLVSMDPYFGRFPKALKPKIYIVDEDEMARHLNDATLLENDGRIIRTKS